MTEIPQIWDNSTLFQKSYSLLQASMKSLNSLERFRRYNLLQDITVIESCGLNKGNSSKAFWLLTYQLILFIVVFVVKFYFLRPFLIMKKNAKKVSSKSKK